MRTPIPMGTRLKLCLDLFLLAKRGHRSRCPCAPFIEMNPFQNLSPYEKLIGDLAGAYSRRINIQHRMVYQVYDAEHTIKIVRIWTHYE